MIVWFRTKNNAWKHRMYANVITNLMNFSMMICMCGKMIEMLLWLWFSYEINMEIDVRFVVSLKNLISCFLEIEVLSFFLIYWNGSKNLCSKISSKDESHKITNVNNLKYARDDDGNLKIQVNFGFAIIDLEF